MQIEEPRPEDSSISSMSRYDDRDSHALVETPRNRTLDSHSICAVIERLMRVDHGMDIDTSEKNPIITVSSSPTDFSLIATGGLEGTVRLWKITHNSEPDFRKPNEILPSKVVQITTLLGHSGQINSVRFSPDGRLLASGSADGTARIYAANGANWKLSHSLRFHTLDVADVAWFSPSVLITTSADRNTVVWDAETGGRTQTLYSDKGSSPKGLAADPKGEFLVVLFDEGLLDIYRRNIDGKFRLTRNLDLSKQDAPNYARAFRTTLYARRLAWSSEGKRLLFPLGSRGRYGPCGVEYDRCNLLDPSPGESLEAKKVFAGHPSRVVVVSTRPGLVFNKKLSEDPFSLSALVSVDGVLSLWASTREQPIAVIANITGPLRVCTDAVWAGASLLLSSSDGSVTRVTLRNLGEDAIDQKEPPLTARLVANPLPGDDIKSAQVETRIGGKRKIQPVIADAGEFVQSLGSPVKKQFEPPSVLKSGDVQVHNNHNALGKYFVVSRRGEEVFKSMDNMQVSSLALLPDGVLLGCLDNEGLAFLSFLSPNWQEGEMRILLPGVIRHMTLCSSVVMFTVSEESLCVWRRDNIGGFESVYDDIPIGGLFGKYDGIETLNFDEAASVPIVKTRSGKTLLFKPKIKCWATGSSTNMN